jgi:hypothetical protein
MEEQDLKVAIEEEMKRHEIAIQNIAKDFDVSYEFILVCC